LRVLLSALACEPEIGSEPEVGFRTMLAAASAHDVWVVTLPESIPAISRALQGDPRAPRVHIEAIEIESRGKPLDDLTAAEFHWRYDRWQREAAVRALQMDRQIDFDVVHHVTLASYWTRAGVSVVKKPLVWGPIGGGVDPPLRLVGELGLRGMSEAVARFVGRPLMAMLPPIVRTQRMAAVTFAQNPDTGRRLRRGRTVRLLSNAFAVELNGPMHPGGRTVEVLFTGRLIPWKGPMLALRSFRYVEHRDAVLRFCGDGPEQARLQRAVKKWGLGGRVRFEGWLPRPRLLSLLGHAGALIHPAVHEEAGLCIAEALTLGTPVVALDHGGPSEIIGQWRGSPTALVAVRSPEVTARSFAAAVDKFLADPPPVREDPLRGGTSFEAEVLRAYEMVTRFDE
jgi:glycosyltransferase involved in cell wall biosynthesis